MLFKPPWGILFKWLGGYPVDRTSHHNLVDNIVRIFDQHDQFAISIAPEGTRKKVTAFKTGFYFIAKKADIPIILTKFDAGNKLISFSPPFYPKKDSDADIRQIESYFSGVEGIRRKKSFVANR